MVGKQMKGKRGGKRGMRGKRSAPRRGKYEVPEVASLTEVQAPVPTPLANQNYSTYNISLASCTRARDVAKGYQFYRIKRVTYVIKPLSDTFNAQALAPGGSAATVPYLYYMIDRTRLFQSGFTIDQLKAMGAKARRLDDKTLTFSYTPNVLSETYDNTANANGAVQYKLAPWLPTKEITGVGLWNPNTTDHLGIVWRVEQVGGTPIGYQLERRIQIEFKKPAVPTTVVTTEDVPIDTDAELAE